MITLLTVFLLVSFTNAQTNETNTTDNVTVNENENVTENITVNDTDSNIITSQTFNQTINETINDTLNETPEDINVTTVVDQDIVYKKWAIINEPVNITFNVDSNKISIRQIRVPLNNPTKDAEISIQIVYNIR